MDYSHLGATELCELLRGTQSLRCMRRAVDGDQHLLEHFAYLRVQKREPTHANVFMTIVDSPGLL
jgi:hypothetical protein